MDFETPDGSQFWLSEVWTEREDGEADFDYTTVSALVDGQAYAGKVQQHMDDVDEADVLQYLEAVPVENIFPLAPTNYTPAPDFDQARYYLKGPQFTYDDCQPGRTFVAQCLLNEVNVLERLRAHPHPNIIKYYGSVARGGRVTNLCLQKCVCNLPELLDGDDVSESTLQAIVSQVRAAIEHLHALGLAHNDINPDNVCIDENGNAILIDFDSCLPFGEPLMKGVAEQAEEECQQPMSTQQNDVLGLRGLEEFFQECVGSMRD